jgi:hypothetical protein|tara:strand:- start:30 stop:296 length:267 start_codon:yes stop_codon:yes gene_type:complete
MIFKIQYIIVYLCIKVPKSSKSLIWGDVKMKKVKQTILIIVFFISVSVFGQILPPPMVPPPPPGLPIDGGQSLLLILALFYGVKKRRN